MAIIRTRTHRRPTENRPAEADLPEATVRLLLILHLGLLGWAMLALGGAGRWAASTITAAAFALGGLTLWGTRGRGWRLEEQAAVVAACLAVAAAWFATQAIFGISLDPGLSRETLLRWTALVWQAAALSRLLRTPSRLAWFCAGVCGLGALQALAGFLIPPAGGYFHQLTRLRGTFSGPNAFAGFLALTVPVSLGLFLQQAARLADAFPDLGALCQLHSPKTWGRVVGAILLLGAVALQGIALLLSGSRGGITAGAVAAGVLLAGFALRARHAPSRGVLWLVALIAAAGLAAAVNRAPQLALQRAERTIEQAEAATSAMTRVDLPSRLQIWSACLDQIRAHPLGVGLGCFELGFLPVHPDSFGDRRVHHAHNDILEGWLEAGWAGFLPIVLAVVLVARLAVGAFGAQGWSVVRAGWAAALIAAGIHALVDFNFSSRPAVTLLGLAAASVLLGPFRDASAPAAMGRSKFLLGIGLVLSAGGGLIAADTARVTWRMEAIRTAVGLPPDPTFYVRPQTRLEDDLADELRRLIRFRPTDARLNYVAGQALLERTQPDFPDAAELYQQAADWFDRSLDHSPSRPEPAALLGVVRAKQTALGPSGAGSDGNLRDRLQSAARALQFASRQAPVDHLVAAMASGGWAEVLARAEAAEGADPQLNALARSELIAQGGIALSGGRAYTDYVLAQWLAAGIRVSEITGYEDLPLRLWIVWYRAVQETAPPEEIIALLRRWEQALDAIEWGEEPSAIVHRDQARGRLWREQCRWHLALGEWPAYRSFQERLNDRELKRATAQLQDSEQQSDAAAGLRRRDLLTEIGPTVPLQLAVADFEYQQGRNTDARNLVLAAAFSEQWNPDDIEAARRFLEQASWTGDAPTLDWLSVRVALENGQAPSITEETVQALPIRFRHRAYWVGARSRLRAGRRDQALRWLEMAREAGPHDPAILETLLRQGRTAPDLCEQIAEIRLPIGVGMEFLGGAVRLVAIDLIEDRGTSFRMAWQFRDQVPADLAVGINVMDANATRTFFERIRFNEAYSGSFRSGRPCLGTTLNLTVEVPRPTPGQTLQFGLTRTGQGWLQSREGLPGVAVADWGRHLRQPPSADGILDIVTSRVDALSGIDPSLLGPDGYSLRSDGNAVTVTAVESSGLRRGIAAAREWAHGFRTYLPEPAFHAPPPESSLPAAPVWKIDRPAFRWRVLTRVSTGATDGDETWRQANGVSPLSPTDRHRVQHALKNIFNPAQWHALYPHWYPEREGERPFPQEPTWQPCLTAKGLLDHAIGEARAAFDRHPARTHFSLAINDGTGWCECETCREAVAADQRALPAADRWWTEPYWGFVRTVAEHVGASHPDRTLTALAYANVLRPPEQPLPPNLEVWLCIDSGGFFDANYRQPYLNTISAWTQRTSRVALYGYAELATWIFPRYAPHELKALLEAAYQAGIQDVYLEGPHLRWTNGPLLWIAGSLLWNPTQDVYALQAAFCRSLFGPAGERMNGYFDRLSEHWAMSLEGSYFGGFKDYARQAQRYPEPVLKELASMLDAAMAESEKPVHRRRIEPIAYSLPLLTWISREARLLDALDAPDAPAANRVAAAQQLAAVHQERNAWLTGQDPAQHPSLVTALEARGTLAAWDERIASALAAELSTSTRKSVESDIEGPVR